MNITQIKQNVLNLFTTSINPETFIYDFLLAYGLPRASITRLQKGTLNLAKTTSEILWKKKLYFKPTATAELYQTIENIRNNPQTVKNDPRFIIVTDFNQLLALDAKTRDTLDIKFEELRHYFDFFLPWSGMEKATCQGENPADVKAANKMAKLFNEIRKDNPELTSKEQLHSLNVFLSRLLFCFFAEDTGIFEAKQFTNAINNYTQVDGSDVHDYLNKIFSIMNQTNRDNTAYYIAKFPYVNGGLFRDNYLVPQFSSTSRKLLLDNGELDWSVINPDIFGSMMQAVVDNTQRSGLGMHYTSVPNIMKVLEPLFLNELKEEFNKIFDSKNKLEQLLTRISNIKIFDPACGSGNFLIIAYKELRKLEIDIMQRIDELTGKPSMQFSQIYLHNFYGIEIDDFAHEIAKLSLWLAEHQMNMVFNQAFGRTAPALPLKDSGNIVCANACRINWEEVCPKTPEDEIYVLGNPPYLGGKMQLPEHKADMSIVLGEFKKYNNLDYIACWFYKASRYIEHNHKVAFVTTNSISQGTQVADLWPNILINVEIFFANRNFQWSNNAKYKAGVTCSIIGLRCKSDAMKLIYDDNSKMNVKNINAYLLDAPNIVIEKRTTPISKLPDMNQGNIPLENGFLRFSKEEMLEIVRQYPDSKILFKRVIGSAELINKHDIYCVWVTEDLKNLAYQIKPIRERIDNVFKFRKTGAENAQACLNRSHQFCMVNTALKNQIVIPIVSSERREYIPIDIFDKTNIIINSALVIYDPEIYLLGLLSSKMHMAWVKSFAGRLKNDFRYSVGVCWFSFPFPSISEDQKKRIEMYVFDVLDEREKHPEKTLAELYDPDKMPDGLRQAHHNLDLAIEQCYRTKPFASDEERLEHLFALYEQMTSKHQ